MELAPKVIEKIDEEDNYEFDHRRNDIAIEQKKFEEPFGNLRKKRKEKKGSCWLVGLALVLDPRKPWVIRLVSSHLAQKYFIHKID